MSGVGFNNFNLLAKSYDANKDGSVNELNGSQQLKDKVDSNKDGNMSVAELATAMKSDSVSVSNGQLVEGKPLNVFTNGLESLKNINSIASNAKATVYERSTYDLKGMAKVDALVSNNREFAGAIRQMESGLRSIKDISRQSNDGISRSVNITAKNAVEDSRNIQIWSLIDDVISNKPYAGVYGPKDDPFSGGNKPSGGNSGGIHSDPFSGGGQQPSGNNGGIHSDPFNGGGQQTGGGTYVPPAEPDIDTSPLERKRADLKTSYEILNSALNNIEQQTSDLPDINNTVKGVDRSISNAFSNITEIKSSKSSPTEVKQTLYKLADAEAGQVKGRGKTFGGVGAGAGLVVGGVTGYLVGKNPKTAMIGAGIGLTAAGAIGALIGSSIDNKHKKNSTELKVLGDEVEKYNPQQDESNLETQSQNTYGKIVTASGRHDIDSAISVNNELKNIKSQVGQVETRTANIAKGYKIAINGHK